jgi:hypothetical protein
MQNLLPEEGANLCKISALPPGQQKKALPIKATCQVAVNCY